MRTRTRAFFGSIVVSAAAACAHDEGPPPQAAHAATPPTTTTAPPGSPAKPRPAWMDRSDANAKVLIDLQLAFTPEEMSWLGVEAADTKIVDLSPGHHARYLQALAAARTDLDARRAKETDVNVVGDLNILSQWADRARREEEVDQREMVPFFDVAKMIFSATKTLLDDQVTPARRASALVRLRKYAGIEPGTTALTKLASDETSASKAKTYPLKQDVEKSLATSSTLLDGVDKLLQKYNLTSEPQTMKALRAQMSDYDAFVRAKILPFARTTPPLPPAVYEIRLEQVGVDLPASEIVSMAHKEFTAIQEQMKPIAAAVAKARNLPSADYRDVVQALKKEQIVGEAIMPHYQERLAQIEAIVREHDLVTLPDRPARMRLASEAESAQSPAPHMVPPRLVGNTGEEGEFVLPLSIPAPSSAKGKAPETFDDFTSASASWTITAHELRPGHELQFDSMVERGVSLARGYFAFNSVNAEGWGLYSEAMILPYMPPEGQLVSLQYRLQRAARAFLDPELQLSKWTFDSARDFLEKEVGLSHAFATAEVERYTFRSPGQATSYFYGYVRLRGLRKEAEEKVGDKFTPKAFHDAILDQGLLPPDVMRQAVLAELGVPASDR